MKQLLQNMRSGETLIAEVPIPTPQAGEVLVKTAASLVSAGTERMLVEFAEKSLLGKARSRPDLVRQLIDKARREGLLTTLEAAFSRLDQPLALGYSSSGTIIALGPGVQGLHVGQRVACAGGGYAVHAEYATLPVRLLAPLPDEVDFESAAFATLGAIAMHGFRLAESQLGERIAVIGLGLLGLLAVEIARSAGCQVLGIDLDSQRVDLANSLGAQAVLRGQAEAAADSFGRGRGCDAVLICADTPSADPVALAGAIARDRARVVAVGAVGLHIPRKIYYEKELTFINSRSYGPGRYDPSYEEGGHDYPVGYVRWTEGRNLEAVVDLLAAGHMDVRPLISHRFPIQDAPQAYTLITGKRREPFLGVLLTYPEQASAPEMGAAPGAQLTAEIAPQQAPDLQAGAAPKVQPSVELAPEKLPAVHPPPGRGGKADGEILLGVLGAGNFASAVLLPVLAKIPQVTLVGIASASGLSAQHALQRFHFRYAASSEEQILSDPQINTVAILTRHHLHARQAAAALSAGKHVFVEKPLALDEDGLGEIVAALDSLQPAPLLSVGFNRRFAPLAVQMKAFLSASQEPLAAHYRVNAGYLPLSHWLQDPRQGGGRIVGEGCHFIDFLTFLVGEPPVYVSGQGLPDSGRYQEDNVALTFAFANGSLGTLSYLANGDKAFPKERVEVFSGGRVAVLDDFRSLETVQDGRRRVLHSRLRQDKGHLGEWLAFSTAVQSGGPPPIPYQHLFGVTRATFAALQALRSGERVPIPGV